VSGHPRSKPAPCPDLARPCPTPAPPTLRPIHRSPETRRPAVSELPYNRARRHRGPSNARPRVWHRVTRWGATSRCTISAPRPTQQHRQEGTKLNIRQSRQRSGTPFSSCSPRLSTGASWPWLLPAGKLDVAFERDVWPGSWRRRVPWRVSNQALSGRSETSDRDPGMWRPCASPEFVRRLGFLADRHPA
jgi:hypothetical protein